MPTVYLSPSIQEFPYVGGGNAEYYMNLIVDAMIPYLRASGIGFTRNNPGDTLESIIERENAYPYDLHLAIQTVAAPEGLSGQLQGQNIYHYAVTSVGGERAANTIANNLKEIYPHPELVKMLPSYVLVEVFRTYAPAVIAQLGYHDNPEDAQWIRDNIDAIAKNLVISIADFLNVQFVDPGMRFQ